MLQPQTLPTLAPHLHEGAARDNVEGRRVLVVSDDTAKLPEPQHVAYVATTGHPGGHQHDTE